MAQLKTLIFIRHAHRELDHPSKDNGLSDKGQEQVKKLVKFAKHRLEGKQPLFVTSPKKRCIETVSPITVEIAPKELVQIDLRLDEHSASENDALYLARIDEFLDFWKYEGPETMVVCSHGDWLPIAIHKLTGIHLALKKGAWVEIEYANAECALTWVVQKQY